MNWSEIIQYLDHAGIILGLMALLLPALIRYIIKPTINLYKIQNVLLNTIDEIREMEDYQNVKKGCNTNNPTSHCKNCSYKELTPILEYVGIWNHIYGK